MIITRREALEGLRSEYLLNALRAITADTTVERLAALVACQTITAQARIVATAALEGDPRQGQIVHPNVRQS